MRILALLLTFGLAACAPQMNTLKPISLKKQPKHQLHLISDNQELQETAATLLVNTNSVVIGQEQSDAQFILILDAQQRTAESAVPKLIGRLGEIEVKPELTLSYQLVNNSGEKIAQNSILVNGSMQKVLSPGSQQSISELNPELTNKALHSLLPEVLTQVMDSAVAKDVISREGIGQVTIAASETHGFAVGDIFLSPGTGSTLKLTRFENYPFSKAYLVLQDGELPVAGETLEYVE